MTTFITKIHDRMLCYGPLRITFNKKSIKQKTIKSKKIMSIKEKQRKRETHCKRDRQTETDNRERNKLYKVRIQCTQI